MRKDGCPVTSQIPEFEAHEVAADERASPAPVHDGTSHHKHIQQENDSIRRGFGFVCEWRCLLCKLFTQP
ncbi:hypothetical protein PPTG_21434 [Phytophthora nicotianae INRA-310]|uniref:Uncharacterized protein n=1 Tax=Phytophthora nicotianae (strain INRA-310) TaxID=761204 RepID=W2R3D4_PHYN3|nr:hypothetical protein PPTG_21434 [Phytophthora nicotianae INRA-310]ETN19219.1 hypothetical protein PPTG_21434 [Phytophthora nicotianae INRA-310]